MASSAPEPASCSASSSSSDLAFLPLALDLGVAFLAEEVCLVTLVLLGVLGTVGPASEAEEAALEEVESGSPYFFLMAPTRLLTERTFFKPRAPAILT